MDMFEGYVKGNANANEGKGTTQKRSQCKHLVAVQNEACFGGYLRNGLVDVSFDTPEMSESFLNMAEFNNWNCNIIENPKNHHIHTIWKLPANWKGKFKRDEILACGLVADVHKDYIPLKTLEGERNNLYEGDFLQAEQLDELPLELYTVESNQQLWNMGEGDGRNDAIRNSILIIQSQLGLDREQVIHILENTNRFVFKESLTNDEFASVTRVELFQKALFYSGNVFKHDVFANYIIANNHIKRVNGQLHLYKEGCYIPGYKALENAMIELIPSIKANQRSEVLKYIEVRVCEESSIEDFANYICFNNGLFDLNKNDIVPFSPDIVVTNKIPWDYNTASYDEITDITLDKISCNDKSIRMLLEEIIGYCFYRSTKYSKAFILTGSGSNGKSTYLETLKRLLGSDNVSQLDLGELGDRFNTVTMASKLANIGDDISEDALDSKTMSVFKKAVTGNGLKAENKGQDVFFFKPSIKLLFSANEVPRMKSKGFSAIKRRLLLVPFNARFTKESPDFDRNIEYKLRSQSAMEYLVKLGIEGLNRLIDNNGFTESHKIEEEIQRFERDNNPIISWLDSLPDESVLVKEDVTTLNQMFQKYCFECGFQGFDIREFSKQVQITKGFVTERRTINKVKKTFYKKEI